MNSARGYTLVEVLVTLGLLAIASVGFYSVLFSGSEGSERAQSIARVAESARAGLNRMVRDTREGKRISATASASLAQPYINSYTVEVDFDQNGTIAPVGTTNTQGDFEVLTYEFAEGAITLNGDILISGVQPLPGNNGIFGVSSNKLAYDWNGDGITTWPELDVASSSSRGIVGVGDNNGLLSVGEWPHLNYVTYALRLSRNGSSEDFYSQAELRNGR